MRFYRKSALLLLLSGGIALPGSAQQQQTRTDQTKPKQTFSPNTENAAHEYKPKPLTLDEGLAILSSALDSRHHAAFSSDCSHFVHGLYERAGFPYSYAPSVELYAGIDQFRRVTYPQPGDLAVWRGHAGIIVNPGQHTFFSLLRSGAGVASYESAYWKKKGRPRFFRYVKSAPGQMLASSVRTASLRPTALEESEVDEDAPEDAISEVPDEHPNRTVAAKSPANQSPVNQSTVNQPLNAASPFVVLVNGTHPKPEQVADAFLGACTDSEQNFRGRDLSKSAQPLIVFDHFTVKKVHIAGTQAWADVQIDELASVTAGRTQARTHAERQRWPLIRRERTEWELVPPPGTVYLPQPVAVRLLAQQLARLTEDTPATARSQEKTELAQLLNVLLHK